MTFRRVAAGVGILALLAALLAIVEPSILPVGIDQVIVSFIGALSLIVAWTVVQSRRHAALREATFPDVEELRSAPSPGDDFETSLIPFLDSSRLHYHRRRIREGLHAAAVAVLTKYEGYSPDDAEGAIATGSWTGDADAASFLGEEPTSPSGVRSVVRKVVTRKSVFHHGLRHTVASIADTAGVTSSGKLPPHNPKYGNDRTRHGGGEPDGTVDPPEKPTLRTTHATGHWRGVSVVAFVSIGIGTLVEQPAVLLAGVAGIGFAAYARSSIFPPGPIAVERSLDENDPDHGDDVEVTVSIQNESGSLLPDLRILDGVPDTLAVGRGSPRLGTALRPGERLTYSYTVEARRGTHTFDHVLLAARDIGSVREQEWVLPAESTLRCTPSLQSSMAVLPLRERETQHVGRVKTGSGGEGVEFFATREYRSTDSLRRIDWNRRAKTGEFSTVEFREEQAATVVLVIDASETAYVAPSQHEPHAVDRAVDAAGMLFASLSENGNRVGLAAVGSTDCWIPPGAGKDHRIEMRETLATHPGLSSNPPEESLPTYRWQHRFREQLSPGTQLVVLSPLCDGLASRFVRRFDAYGYPVTVVSPDPTTDGSTGHLLARVGRELRVAELRGSGIPVVNWPWDSTVDVAIARYRERWS